MKAIVMAWQIRVNLLGLGALLWLLDENLGIRFTYMGTLLRVQLVGRHVQTLMWYQTSLPLLCNTISPYPGDYVFYVLPFSMEYISHL